MDALVRELGLNTVATHTQGDNLFEFGGRTWRSAGLAPPVPFLARLDIAQLAWRIDWLARRVPPARPWDAPRAVARDRRSVANWLRANTLTRLGREYWLTLAETATCVEASEISALDLLHQIRTLGGLGPLATAEQDFFPDGAQAIAERLAAALPRPVHLRAPVRRIEHGPGGVRLVTDAAPWRARRVIIAIPPALVGRIDFQPALPESRRRLGESTVRGSVVKAVAVFDHAYWRARGLSGLALTQGGPMSLLMDGSLPNGMPGVLVALATGRHARLLGGMSPADRRSTVLGHVRRCFGPEPTSPSAFLDRDWSQEDWTGGGYASRLRPAGWTRFGSALISPVGPIHWAGTETATEWRSYMEGAVESGERAADEVSGAAT
jgi:monoamine oxidase